MTKTVWKFDLDAIGEIQMPAGAEVLSVQMRNGEACIWALVDPTAEIETVRLNIFGTGNNVPDNPGRFIDTLQMNGGDLVFHVFEAAREETQS